MKVLTRHISDLLEHWAPSATKMDYDNTGLLVGNPDQQIDSVLTCLDITPSVIQEAIQKKVQLIVAHHPIIFPKIKRIVSTDPVGAMLQQLLQNNISVIASHTNLDAARGGVSSVLANTLGLKHTSFLDDSYQTMRRVILRIPSSLKENVTAALHDLDVVTSVTREEQNIIVMCFNTDKHYLGEIQNKLGTVIKGAPHNLDIIPLEGSSPLFGFGITGYLEEPLPAAAFLELLQDRLQATGVRWSGGAKNIHKVAVCGGSGSFLINKALGSGADAFVTADIKYHDFFVPDHFLLVDAGHYETEAPIIGKLQESISTAFPQLNVYSTTILTNPMRGMSP